MPRIQVFNKAPRRKKIRASPVLLMTLQEEHDQAAESIITSRDDGSWTNPSGCFRKKSIREIEIEAEERGLARDDNDDDKKGDPLPLDKMFHH